MTIKIRMGLGLGFRCHSRRWIRISWHIDQQRPDWWVVDMVSLHRGFYRNYMFERFPVNIVDLYGIRLYSILISLIFQSKYNTKWTNYSLPFYYLLSGSLRPPLTSQLRLPLLPVLHLLHTPPALGTVLHMRNGTTPIVCACQDACKQLCVLQIENGVLFIALAFVQLMENALLDIDGTTALVFASQ
jgi:hypothetical protein